MHLNPCKIIIISTIQPFIPSYIFKIQKQLSRIIQIYVVSHMHMNMLYECHTILPNCSYHWPRSKLNSWLRHCLQSLNQLPFGTSYYLCPHIALFLPLCLGCYLSCQGRSCWRKTKVCVCPSISFLGNPWRQQSNIGSLIPYYIYELACKGV